MKQLFRESWFLRLLMCLIELFWVNLFLWIFFHDKLLMLTEGQIQNTSIFGWIALLKSFSYLCGVYVTPMSFFYRRSRAESIVKNVFKAQTLSIAIFLLFLLMMHASAPFQTYKTILFWLCSCFALIAERLFAKYLIKCFRKKGFNIHYVVLVGDSSNLAELYEEMRDPCFGYRVIGYFYDAPVANLMESLNYLGSVDDIIPYLNDHRVDHVYCSLPSKRETEILQIFSYCEHHCIRFFSVPNVRNYLKRQMEMELYGRVPLLYVREDPLSQFDNRIIKRTFDLIVSGLFMVPFWLIIYPIVGSIIKITSRGPIFFKQRRNGLNGRIFYCYKFRSMKVNSASDLLQATADDPRKTKFGDFLRRSSIDELPQFINVLKGEMSVVGPRPHMLKHTEQYSAIIDSYMVRHWVKPGITGWAQVNGARGETRYKEQMEDRVEKDIWYIENWSFLLDLKIIFLTVYNVFIGDKQAY